MSIIGFLIIEFAVISFITFVTGWDLTLKEKILMILGFMFFLTTLAIGVGMITGWS